MVAGYIVGVIVLLGGLFFIPLVLFVLWMLVVGIVMLRGQARRRQAEPQATHCTGPRW